jgi:hypothetical protein
MSKRPTIVRVEAILGRDVMQEQIYDTVDDLCTIIEEYRKKEKAARDREKMIAETDKALQVLLSKHITSIDVIKLIENIYGSIGETMEDKIAWVRKNIKSVTTRGEKVVIEPLQDVKEVLVNTTLKI